MSKDLVLSKTYNAATKEHFKIQIDYTTLEFFYFKLEPIKSEFPVLWKIVEDFYRDVEINSNELLALKDEIKKLISGYKKIKIYKIDLEFLKNLQLLCDEGIKKRLILWALAD